MLTAHLSLEARALLDSERQLLAEVAAALAADETAAGDRSALAGVMEQLEDLFLVVVVGEFNAGKSAFLNVLLGVEALPEGVTPTTSRLALLRWGAEVGRVVLDPGRELVTLPAELLRETTFVDTPGTNALDRQHEALTEEFVPRADLVLFVTSADRPFSESERAFLERIRTWGKKVAVVLNKVDILPSAEAVAEVEAYIRVHAHRLLALEPPVLPVSVRDARRAANVDALEASGLPAVERFLGETLAPAERVRLKLESPLGVAERVIQAGVGRVEAAQALLAEDLATIADIDRQLAAYAADVGREFELRLTDLEATLARIERRGLAFFDDRVRVGRVRGLLDRDRLRADFEREVVADAPEEVERKVGDLVDWLVESDLTQWQAVVQHVSRRRSAHADRVVGELTGRFSADRARLLDTVGQAARQGLERYDRAAEARRVADDLQRAVAGAAIAEVGAVGLGAAVAWLATSTAVDATGFAAAGLLAALGLVVLPTRRRQAKRELGRRIEGLKTELMGRLRHELGRAAEGTRARIRETVAPYVRFVRSERDALAGRHERLAALRDRVAALRGRIQAEI